MGSGKRSPEPILCFFNRPLISQSQYVFCAHYADDGFGVVYLSGEDHALKVFKGYLLRLQKLVLVEVALAAL